jgi:hypothetical protein
MCVFCLQHFGFAVHAWPVRIDVYRFSLLLLGKKGSFGGRFHLQCPSKVCFCVVGFTAFCLPFFLSFAKKCHSFLIWGLRIDVKHICTTSETVGFTKQLVL